METGWYRLRANYRDGSRGDQLRWIGDEVAYNINRVEAKRQQLIMERVLILSEEEFEELLAQRLQPKESEEEFIVQ